MIRMLRGRPMMSSALMNGRNTSEFGLAFGFGCRFQIEACCSVTSKSPRGVKPWNAIPMFSAKVRASVMSTEPDLRLANMWLTLSPSWFRSLSEPLSKPTIEIRTAGSSECHLRSETAKNIPPDSLIFSSTLRDIPPLIACVANNPARFASPVLI